MDIRQLLRSLLPTGAVALAMLLGSAAGARALDWQAAAVHGSVLRLVQNQWLEIAQGDIVSAEEPLRTLQAGRVELRRGGDTVALGPGTAIQPRERGAGIAIDQYSGSVVVTIRGGGRYTLRNPAFVTESTQGSFEVDVRGNHAVLRVRQGTVTMSSGSSQATLTAGQSADGDEGGRVQTSSAAGPPAATAATTAGSVGASAETAASGVAVPGKSDNGKGNGGVPGNGGLNGNGNGNGNGHKRGD